MKNWKICKREKFSFLKNHVQVSVLFLYQNNSNLTILKKYYKMMVNKNKINKK